MTSVDFALSRTAGRELAPGDEILASSLDHDGGVAPWLELARDRDLVVRHVELRHDTTLDLDDLEAKLSARTRVVAFAWASNAVGTIVDAARVCELAHAAGALAWIDAVHYAAHEPIDVGAIGADVLICSPYKFCGPHLGLAFGRPRSSSAGARTRRGRPRPIRSGGGSTPARCPTSCSRASTRRSAYVGEIGGMDAIVPYERGLGERFVGRAPRRGLALRAAGDGGPRPDVPAQRRRRAGTDVARAIAARGIGVWAHDSWYALDLYRRLGYDDQAVRVGFIHYNTADEVDRFLGELERLASP